MQIRADAFLQRRKSWTDPLQLDSLRKQVRMPGGKEKGSHHGREKKIYSNFQAAGSGGGVPYYVAEKDAITNSLVVGEGPNDPILFKKCTMVGHLNWFDDFRDGRCEVRIRYRQPKVPALVRREDNCVQVLFDGSPVRCSSRTVGSLLPSRKGIRRRNYPLRFAKNGMIPIFFFEACR